MARWITCLSERAAFNLARRGVGCCAVVDITTEPVMQVTWSFPCLRFHAFYGLLVSLLPGPMTNTSIGDISSTPGRWDVSGTEDAQVPGTVFDTWRLNLFSIGLGRSQDRSQIRRDGYTGGLGIASHTSTALSDGTLQQEVNIYITRRRVISAPPGSKLSFGRSPPLTCAPKSRTPCRMEERMSDDREQASNRATFPQGLHRKMELSFWTASRLLPHGPHSIFSHVVES